jgi:hypothetical protein
MPLDGLFGSQKCIELTEDYNSTVIHQFNKSISQFITFFDYDGAYSDKGLDECIESFALAKSKAKSFKRKYGLYCAFNITIDFLLKEIEIYRGYLNTIKGDWYGNSKIVKRIKADVSFTDDHYTPGLSTEEIRAYIMRAFTVYCYDNRKKDEFDSFMDRMSMVVMIWGNTDPKKDAAARATAMNHFDSDMAMLQYLETFSDYVIAIEKEPYPYTTQTCIESLLKINKMLDLYSRLSGYEKALLRYGAHNAMIEEKLNFLTILYGTTKDFQFYRMAQQHMAAYDLQVKNSRRCSKFHKQLLSIKATAGSN